MNIFATTQPPIAIPIALNIMFMSFFPLTRAELLAFISTSSFLFHLPSTPRVSCKTKIFLSRVLKRNRHIFYIFFSFHEEESQTKEATKKRKAKFTRGKKLFRLFGVLIYSSSSPFNFSLASLIFTRRLAVVCPKADRKTKKNN